MPFRGSAWLKLDPEENQECSVDTDRLNPFDELKDLINIFVIEMKEVFTLTSLKLAYESLNKDNKFPILRSVDIRSKLLLAFPDKIYFTSPTYSSRSTRIKVEYVLLVRKLLTADCISGATSCHGISDTLRNSARKLHETVTKSKKKIDWPPTPQEIIENKDPCHPNTYNHIAWMVNPNASMGTQGLVKLSKSKELKVLQISQNIESLMPNSPPSLDQLLSLTLHRKTGSSDAINTLNRLGYGVPYTEVCFVENKWAEWDEKQNCSIPSNITKGLCTTHVADNIDWQNKSLSGKQTHNTNSIVIQNEISDSSEESHITLTSDYDYVRKDHRSYKGTPINIPEFNYVKSKCTKFSFHDYKIIKQDVANLEMSSDKTFLKDSFTVEQ